MITFIDIASYYPLFINTCFALVLFTILHLLISEIDSDKNIFFINIVGYIFLVLLIAFIGLRPIDGVYFGDTANYDKAFQRYANGGELREIRDIWWQIFMKFMASFTNIHIFLTICCFLYIFPFYKISKEIFKEYWWYSFIMLVISFSFWPYAVNGVRNGVACSLFLLGFAYRKKIPLMIAIFFIAASFHKTVLLPIFAYILTLFYNNPKFYLKAWAYSIPVSLVLGGIFIGVFATLGFGDDDRLSGYLNSGGGTAFRWDFIFHSAFAVFSGWYFIIKKGFNDKIYNHLLNTYLICNSFWILVIKANFSNRFAYLSWFMMAIIVIYPFLKGVFFKNQQVVMSKVIFAYFMFTYLMTYLYYA